MAISIEGKEGPGLMTNTDKLDRAKTLSKEITMYKTMRNRVHKDIRGHKANRDEANNLVANLISKAKELEVKRNTLNRSVGQLKTSRDIYTGLIKETKMKRHQTGTSQNAAQQSALHRKVKNEARRSQKAQHELNSVGKEIQIASVNSRKAVINSSILISGNYILKIIFTTGSSIEHKIIIQ